MLQGLIVFCVVIILPALILFAALCLSDEEPIDVGKGDDDDDD